MNTHQKKSVLFIVPYPEKKAPGQRFRFELFLNSLNKAGISYQVKPFLRDRAYEVIFRKGHLLHKLSAVISGFIRRLVQLASSMSYDFIYIYREATPVGPPWWEWTMHVFGKKVIYDFDDAIWLKDDNEKRFPGSLKWKQKVPRICKWSYKISVGNAYLHSYAEKFNPRAEIIPTVVDTAHHTPGLNNHSILTIGWTGSHSTLPYLDSVMPVLRKLHEQADFRFIIIADQDPGFSDEFVEFRKWNIETEIKDLKEIDIGIMPLPDSPWAKGKCGFKLIQYLALEIPAVASDVGVNRKILGDAGYICSSNEEWENALYQLLNNKKLRNEMGISGRKFIEENYSLMAVEEKFIGLFN